MEYKIDPDEIDSNCQRRIYPCSNCNNIFEENQLTISFKVRDVFSHEMISVQVSDAIAYIYGKSLEELQCHLDNTIKASLTNVIVPNSVKVCTLCDHLLSQIYTSILKFENLTNPNSVVWKIQKGCRRQFENGQLLNAETTPHTASILSPNEKDEEFCDSFNLNYNDEEENIHLGSDNNIYEEFKFEPVNGDETNGSFERTSEILKNTILSPSANEESVSNIKTEIHSDRESLCSNENEATSDKSQQKFNGPVKESNLESKEKCQDSKEKDSKKFKEDGSVKLPEKQKGYSCHICGKVSMSQKSLKKHHIPSHFKNTTCNICQKTLSSLSGLHSHLKFTHKHYEDVTSDCEICGKNVLYTNMGQHMKIHGQRAKYQCGKCGKVYLGETNFLAHEKMHITETKHCSICLAQFQSTSSLNQHIRTHSTERPFVCDNCGKGFRRRAELDKHMKIYKEEEVGSQSAKCDHCGKLLKNSHRLKKHVQNIHLKRKMFQCSFCGKELSSQKKLASHKNLHKNDQQYNIGKND